MNIWAAAFIPSSPKQRINPRLEMSCESPALQNRSMSQVTQILAQKYKLYQYLAEIKKSRSRKSTLLYLQVSDIYSCFSSLLIFLVMILRNTRCLLTLNLRSSSKAWMASQNIHIQFIKKANAISNSDNFKLFFQHMELPQSQIKNIQISPV